MSLTAAAQKGVLIKFLSRADTAIPHHYWAVNQANGAQHSTILELGRGSYDPLHIQVTSSSGRLLHHLPQHSGFHGFASIVFAFPTTFKIVSGEYYYRMLMCGLYSGQFEFN